MDAPAHQIAALWAKRSEDDSAEEAMSGLINQLLDAGDQEGLTEAQRLIGTKDPDDAMEFLDEVRLEAASVILPGATPRTADLFAIPVAVTQKPAFPSNVADGLLQHHLAPATTQIHLMRGWVAPRHVTAMSPTAMRKVVRRLAQAEFAVEPRMADGPGMALLIVGVMISSDPATHSVLEDFKDPMEKRVREWQIQMRKTWPDTIRVARPSAPYGLAEELIAVLGPVRGARHA